MATPTPPRPRLPREVKKLSLRPYVGILYIARTRRAYERAHVQLFGKADKLDDDTGGMFATHEAVEGGLVYLAYADTPRHWVHELSHVVIHLFEYLQNPITSDNSEPFCYLLHTLWQEAIDYTTPR